MGQRVGAGEPKVPNRLLAYWLILILITTLVICSAIVLEKRLAQTENI